MTLGDDSGLGRYLADLHLSLLSEPGAGWREFEGTLVFADISGFTPLTERLSRQGKIGAELLTGALKKVFTELLAAAGAYGGDCLKFGGDALMLLFRGEDHARRAVAGADAVRDALRVVRRQRDGGGPNLSRLNMSMGVHSGTVHAFLVGSAHKELVVTGPAVTGTLVLEGLAEAGEILISATTAAELDERSYEMVQPGAYRLLKAPDVDKVAAGAQVDRGVAAAGLCEILRDYLPTAPEDGEHRLAAVCFIQFGGVDEIVRTEGPAVLYERLQAMVGRVGDVLARNGITYLDTDINKDGGKIWLTASAPKSSDDDEDRLLQAVSEVLADPPVRLRAGINRGRVFALNLGSSGRRTYTVMGDAVNLAARVMGKAEWGQALATTAVVERTRVDFQPEPVPPFMVKGKSEPVSAAVVHAPRGTRELPPGRTTGLLGRDDELTVIEAAIESAFQGEGRLVSIVGPAGIGKSRLLDEALHRADGMLTVRVDGGRYSLATPYFALRRPMLAGLGLRLDASPAVIEATLRDVVEAVAPDLLPYLPLLGGPVGLNIEDTPRTAALTGAQRQTEAARVIVEYIRRTVTVPALLVIDAAHWIDTASTTVLTDLFADVDSRPWAVLIARRAEPGGFEPSDAPAVRVINLGPLERQAALAMAAQELAGVHLKPGVLEELVDRADGNPLFLRELVEAAKSGSVAELPDTVEKVIAANIDTLPAADRALLRHAAVLGNKFEGAWLAGMLGRQLGRTTADLARLDHFLHLDAGGMARFQHVLLRDVAYEGLPFRTRRELHGKAGDLLEHASGSDPNRLAGLLSIHFHSAGRYDKSWQYSLVAGTRSSRQGAPVEAARFFERALLAASELGLEPAMRAEAAENLGDAWDVAGRFDEATAAFRKARRFHDSSSLARAGVARKIAAMLDRTGDYAASLRWLRSGLRDLDAGDAASAAQRQQERAHLMVNRATVLNRQGRYAQALPTVLAAIDEARPGGDTRTLAHAYRILDQVYLHLGRPAEAVHSAESLRISLALGDTHAVANSYNTMGVAAVETGRWDLGVEMYQHALEAVSSLGNVVDEAMYQANIAELRKDQGRLEDAIELFGAAREVWAGAGWKDALGWLLGNLGQAYARAGRMDEARACFDEAEQVLTSIGGRASLTDARVRELEMYVLAGDPRALDFADTVRAEAHQLRMVGVTATLERLSGYALARQGRLDEGIAAMRRGLAEALERRLECEAGLAYQALGRVAGEGASTDEGRRILDRLGVVWTPEFPLAG